MDFHFFYEQREEKELFDLLNYLNRQLYLSLSLYIDNKYFINQKETIGGFFNSGNIYIREQEKNFYVLCHEVAHFAQSKHDINFLLIMFFIQLHCFDKYFFTTYDTHEDKTFYCDLCRHEIAERVRDETKKQFFYLEDIKYLSRVIYLDLYETKRLNTPEIVTTRQNPPAPH